MPYNLYLYILLVYVRSDHDLMHNLEGNFVGIPY